MIMIYTPLPTAYKFLTKTAVNIWRTSALKDQENERELERTDAC